jgi:hypothetical protein
MSGPVHGAAARPDAETTSTLEIPLPARLLRLRRVVIGTLLGCGLILVAAGIARLSRDGTSPAPPERDLLLNRRFPASPGPERSPELTSLPAAAPPPMPAGPGGTATATDPARETMGTLRLEPYMTPRWIWFDGKRLTSRSERVPCGTHQFKVGHGQARSIEVPCGGELHLIH